MSVFLAMATINKNRIATLLGISLTAWLGATPGLASPQASPSLPQIGPLEHRFFFHQYPHDPTEKRLERLELLIFGNIQEGTNDERIARIKQMVSERDQKSANQTRGTEKKPPVAESQPGRAKGSSQYPALNTLEWRVLSKTYPQDSLDQRLDRLETKLFGQSSPAMAYADRVERLNRTLGIGASPDRVADKLGPRPKARPHGQYFGWSTTAPRLPAPVVPFGGLPPGDINNQFNEMFRQLDQQMQQMQPLMQLPPGQYQWDFEFPAPTPGNPVVPPNTKPRTAPKHTQPLLPYYDPNAT